MKKILALLLVLVMVLGCCACGAQTETEMTETTTPTTEKTETKTEETEKVEETEEEMEMLKASAVVFSTIGFPPVDDAPMEDHYREYGLDLEILPVDTGTDESWNIFWASGGYADIIIPYNWKPELFTEGLTRTIEFDWIKEYMPRLYTGLTKVYGSDEAIIKELTINGEIRCIPYYTDTGVVSWTAGIRNDWLEAVGLEAPTTVEEYGEVLRAFTEDDPDGNGIDDTYGCDSISHGLWNIPAAFGTSNTLSFWKGEDGTITTNAVADNYREFLRTVAAWYQNGWMDPEGITDDRGAIRNKWAVGKMGVYCDNPWWFEFNRGETGPLQMLCDGQSLDFSTACTFVTGIESVETGEPVILSLYDNICDQTSAWFGYDCPDEVVIRYMQMIDTSVVLYDGTEEDKEAQCLWYARRVGEEGVHWERDEEGYPVQLVGATPEEAQANGWNYFGASHLGLVDTSLFAGEVDEFCIDLYADCLIQNKVFRGSNCTLPTPEGDIADMRTNISDYFGTCQTAFITGEMDLDADWDTYVATMEEYGLNELIAFYQENA